MGFKKVGFIGFGNMGRAIAEGLIRSGHYKRENFLVSVKSEESKQKLEGEGFKVETNEGVVKNSEILFLAVKPKDLKKVLEEIKPFLGNKPLISVAAGVPLKTYLEVLGESAKAVRSMPNLNVKIGKGIWGITFAPAFGGEEREEIKKFLSLTGEVLEVDESLIDAITALAGSGPAFVAEIIDAYAQAGVKLGFKHNEALKIALQTFLGTLELLKEENIHPSMFRDKITSPAGTTIYGLHLLNEKGIKGNLISVVEAAYKRAKGIS